MNTNVTFWLDESAEKFGDKIAFEDDRKKITFKELQRQAKGIASYLLQREILKKPVAIYMEKGVDMLVSFMGTAYSCNFYSPVDIGMPAKRVIKILEVLKPNIVITTNKLKENFKCYGDRKSVV